MGLDLVEILMETEKEFEISILDSEVYEAVTVGKYVNVVYSRLRKDQNDPCPSQHAFYLIRQGLMQTFEIPRLAIKLETELDKVVPKRNRRQLWEEFKRSVFGQWVSDIKLVLPGWLDTIFTFAIPIAVFLGFIVKFSFDMAWIGLIVAVLSSWFLHWLFTPLKTQFQLKYATIRDLLPFLSTTNPKTWTENEVFVKIQQITEKVVGIDPELITMESNWVNDLGVE